MPRGTSISNGRGKMSSPTYSHDGCCRRRASQILPYVMGSIVAAKGSHFLPLCVKLNAARFVFYGEGLPFPCIACQMNLAILYSRNTRLRRDFPRPPVERRHLRGALGTPAGAPPAAIWVTAAFGGGEKVRQKFGGPGAPHSG